MPRDIVLTVAAATVGPQVAATLEKPGFALEVLVPKLEVGVDVRTRVAVELVGEAL